MYATFYDLKTKRMLADSVPLYVERKEDARAVLGSDPDQVTPYALIYRDPNSTRGVYISKIRF